MKTQTGIGLAVGLALALLAGLAPWAEAANKYWIATTAANWNNTANWSLSSGGTGGAAVPGANDVAIFDGANGANGNCNIDAAVNVTGSGGINIGAGYSGTITQGAFAITMGTVGTASAGWTQAGGAFTGYTTDASKGITINSGSFTLSGGVFNSTAGTLLMDRGVGSGNSFTHSGGTFNHNNGTVEFKMNLNAGAFNISAPAITFYNLTLNGARNTGGTLGAGNVLTVNNTLTYTAWDEYSGMSITLDNGTIDVKGNLVVGAASARRDSGTTVIRMSSTGAQSISGGSATAWLPIVEINKSSGTVTATGDLYMGEFRLTNGTFTSTSGTLTLGYNGSGNWTHTAGGTFNHNNGTVHFKMKQWTASTIDVMGTETFYNLKLMGGRGSSVGLSSDTLVVFGKLTIDMWDGYNDGANCKINTGVLQVEGDVDLLNSLSLTQGPRGGNATVTFKGANNQSVKLDTGNIPPTGTWTIDKTGGSMTLAKDLSLGTTGQQLVWTNGAVDLSSNTLTVAGATTIYSGATTLGVTVADATKVGLLKCNSALSTITNLTLAMTVAATEAQTSGQTYMIVTNTSALASPFKSVTWPGLWAGNVSYSASGGKAVTVANIHQQAPAGPITILNLPPTGVATNGATFNGQTGTNGFDTAAVYVAWGQTNGTVSGSWANTNWWTAGAWTNSSTPFTNLTLAANANYYYTFGATNSTTNVTAIGYQYLITGEVTVQPTDPTGRVTLADTAAFTVYRPASCTNDALTVAYTLGGTATNGIHYTNSPAASGTNGAVTIAAGQTNAVVTVWPLNITAPQQTVVLTLVSSNYPVGTANSATCTLAAAVVVYNDIANGNWNSTSTWSPTGYPGGGDTAVIDSQTVTANISLTNSTAPASITVSTGGTVSHGDGVVVASPVTLAGGTWAQGVLGAVSAMRLTGAVTVTTNSLFTGGRGNAGIWLDGPVSGTNRLTFRGVDYYSSPPQPPDGAEFYLTAASNTLSGGLVVESNYVNVIAVSNQSLGTGDIAVNANATLSFQRTQDYTGAPRTPVVTLTTNSSVVGFTTTDNMTLPFGLVVQGGGKLTTESWRLGEIWSGAVTLNGNLTLAAWRASGSGTSIILSGLVSGPGGMVVNADDSYNGEQGVVELRRGTNTYAGGTTVSYGRLKVSADQALGTGPVTVYNTLIPSGQRTALLLDATPDMNWSLSNSIAGEGTIKVEDGSSYRLTESGTVSPGTNTAAVAVLTVNGKFAFAKSGATPATLAIDVATAGTLAGTNYDQLAVTTGDVALASSITNCTLVVTLMPTPVQMNGLTLTILSAPGADFTPYQFASVSGLGTGGSATYSNGAVYLTWTLATPVINNGAYSNLMATSCDVSGVLSSTGSAPATVRCYYGTNSAGTSGWAYTNYLGTQGVGTVSTSLTGLTSNVKYYYRFYATNDVGEYWSVATSNFTTLGDIYWNDAANGNWRANDANTWGAGLNVYPQNPLNDHVTNDSHVVSVTSATAIVAADVTLTTSVGATGTLSFVNAAAQSQNLILDGGRLGTYSDGNGAGDVVLTGNLRMKSASILDPGAHGNRLNLANSTLNGNIEDYGAGTTGVLRVDGSLYGTLLGQASGRLLYNGISTNFTGGWLIDCAGDATSGYFWLGIEKDGGLGASTVTVTRGQINIDATQSSTAQRPAPARVIVNPAGRLLVGAGAGPSVTVTNWTVDLNGGHLRCYGPMKLAGGTVNVNADSAVWGWGYFGAGTKEFACQLTGTSALSFTYDNNGTGPFVLAGDNSGFSGSVRLLKDSLTVSHTNGLGTGPVLLASQTGGKLTLDRPGGSFDWTLANNLSGGCTNGSTAVALQVEDGAGTNTLTVLGTVDPGTNGVAGASNIVSLLRVDGSVAFGAGSRLKIDITGTNGVAGVDFDRLVVDHNLTGLGNVTLEVNVSATLSNAAIRGLDVVVVSNATSFGSARFGSVQFTAPWAADVLYDNPPGTVRLMNFQDFRGTVFKFR